MSNVYFVLLVSVVIGIHKTISGCTSTKTKKGYNCVLPFKYQNITYDSCTLVHSSKPWCALTPDYDVDKKWDYCKKISCPSTITQQGYSCVFPFAHNGMIFDSCTLGAVGMSTPWCAVNSDATKTDYCYKEGCPFAVTVKGKTCVFPFQYKGILYDSCTYVDSYSPHPWCALTHNYDTHLKSEWDYCKKESCSSTLTEKGESCAFPFKYKEKTYHSCTLVDSPKLWCAITQNYDTDKKWGYCYVK